jgi:hypothetical protein
MRNKNQNFSKIMGAALHGGPKNRLTKLFKYDKISITEDFMYNFNEEKENLVKMLSEQYSQNIINMEEYERMLEYINKIETKKEINIIENNNI